MKVGYGRRSFSDENRIRRAKNAEWRKQQAKRVQRQKAHTQNAINQMQNNANIFAIKTNQSASNIELVMQQAQKRALDAVTAKRTGLGQNVNKVA